MEIGVLATLALSAGTPVAASGLVDVLWPQEPPRTAGKTLQGYVKRVRGILAGHGIELTHVGTGYQLMLTADRIDALQFESLVALARTSDDDRVRLRRLDDALALWRGEPFAGCDLDGLRPHRDWLSRLRSGTRVERAATQVRLGVSADTIAGIRALLLEDPTNERLWLHLAGALYFLGNPVAALEAISQARHELAERVGVAPGPELTELQAHMLRHDDVEGCYYRLSGATRPVLAAGAAPRPVPPASMSLPQWGGELIGRDEVVAEIVGLLDGPPRIITITGPGGMGKTRCAVEAAGRAATPCLGFVDLSALSTGADMALHLSGSFGVPDRDDPAAALATQVDGVRASVILDNTEQIPDAAVVVQEFARRCPSVSWLVTSQTELGLDAERVIRLAPLSGQPDEPGGGAPSPSAALLRAAARRRGILLPHDAPLEQIAALVGGIPLALELAACQLQHLEPGVLLRSLADPIDALIDPRQPVTRHRSMRECFQFALNRLGPESRDLFALVSRRPGGVRYDDLAAWWPHPVPLPRAVAELVEVGFASTGLDSSAATRITQLPLVRAFGATLAPGPDEVGAQQALDSAVLARAFGSMTAPRSEAMEPDLPDIRRLLQRGLDDPDWLECALRLATSLRIYWWEHRLTEGRRWLTRLLRADDAPLAIRPHAVSAVAFLDFYVGDADSARDWMAPALAADADPIARAMLLSLQGMLDAAEGAHELARQREKEAMALSRLADAQAVLSYSLGNAGDVALAAGDVAAARGFYVECMDRLRRVGADWLSAAPCARLGDLELSAGQYRRARMWYERSVSLWSSRELGPGVPQALAGLARLEVVEGDLDGARRTLEMALATAERVGSRGEYPWVVLGFAAWLAAREDFERAAVLFALGLRHGRRAGHAVSRLAEAELAPFYARCRPHSDGVDTDPVVVATKLEDLPAVIAGFIGS